MLAEPAVVLLAVAIAAVLFLLEVALPTGGLAGAASAVGIVVAVWGIASEDFDWWPLALVAAAITAWGALVARRRTPLAAQVVAAALYAGGSMGFAVANDNALAVVVAAVTSVALPLAFPLVARAADRLADLPSQMGAESLPGRRGSVLAWEGESGSVRLDGSVWQARGPAGLEPGAEVTVVASDRMTLIVGATMPA